MHHEDWTEDPDCRDAWEEANSPKETKTMFNHLPLQTHIQYNNPTEREAAIPASHSLDDFIRAVAHVQRHPDQYGYNENHDIAKQAFDIWVWLLDETDTYVRPDILVAALQTLVDAHIYNFVSYLVEEIIEGSQRPLLDQWLSFRIARLEEYNQEAQNVPST